MYGNTAYVFSQVLDFERESEYILVLGAQNPVALVRGRYGLASTATVTIYVDDINEGPILSQSHYEVTVREGEEPGRVIATIRGYDPDSHPIRWTLQITKILCEYSSTVSQHFRETEAQSITDLVLQRCTILFPDILFKGTPRNIFQ